MVDDRAVPQRDILGSLDVICGIRYRRTENVIGFVNCRRTVCDVIDLRCMNRLDFLGVIACVGNGERNRGLIYREWRWDARLDECVLPVAVSSDIESVVILPVFRRSGAVITRNEVLDDVTLVVHDGSVRMVDVLLRDNIVADTGHEARFDIIYLLDFRIAIAHLVGNRRDEGLYAGRTVIAYRYGDRLAVQREGRYGRRLLDIVGAESKVLECYLPVIVTRLLGADDGSLVGGEKAELESCFGDGGIGDGVFFLDGDFADTRCVVHVVRVDAAVLSCHNLDMIPTAIGIPDTASGLPMRRIELIPLRSLNLMHPIPTWS